MLARHSLNNCLVAVCACIPATTAAAHEAPSLSLMHAQVTDDYTVIGRNLFKKETNLQLFVGLKVNLSTGETGVIEGGFGQSGKFKIRVQGKDPLQRHDVSETPSPLSDPSSNDGAASRRPSHFKLIGVVEFHVRAA